MHLSVLFEVVCCAGLGCFFVASLKGDESFVSSKDAPDSLSLEGIVCATLFSATKPRNPRHFGTIEGGGTSVAGGRTTRNTQRL